jgi:pimeloyl-ACP methyl ester carboxylesterase
MRLVFDTAGPDLGPPIVLLHGLTGSRERYSYLVDWLSSRGYRVVNVDLRGHGESAWAATYRAVDFASDVAELIDAEHIGSAVVIGHSMGGTVASTLAAREPDAVKALFLEDPALYDTGEDSSDADIGDDTSEAEEFIGRVRGWQTSGVTESDLVAEIGQWPTPYPDKTLQDLLEADHLAVYARALLAFDPAAMEAALSGDLFVGYDPETPIECPVTVLTADPTLGAAFLLEHGGIYAATNPQVRIVLAEGSSHSILNNPSGHSQYMKSLEELLHSL